MSNSTKVTLLSLLLILSNVATWHVIIERDDLRTQLEELQNNPVVCPEQPVPVCPEPIATTKPEIPTLEHLHYGIDKRGKCFGWSETTGGLHSVDCKYLSHRPLSK